MQSREITRLGRSVSVVDLGTWQLGADWGDVSAEAADGVRDVYDRLIPEHVHDRW